VPAASRPASSWRASVRSVQSPPKTLRLRPGAGVAGMQAAEEFGEAGRGVARQLDIAAARRMEMKGSSAASTARRSDREAAGAVAEAGLGQVVAVLVGGPRR
jgi:hypothetical protein